MADADVEMTPAENSESPDMDESKPDEVTDAAVDEPKGPTTEERVSQAETLKEEGNSLLKASDLDGAMSKYREGIELTEPLLEKDPTDIGEDLQRRGTLLYIALRLNSAQACIKQSNWVLATEHAEKVLLLEKDNTKALYRRGLAALQLDTEGRLEQARSDFARLAQLEPSNREARELHQKAKERLKEMKQKEKERLQAALSGGLYEEHHRKHMAEQAAYDEEVKRRKSAGEDEISFEDWKKKEKERIEELEKKQKEETEKRQQEEYRLLEERRWEEDNEKRKADGKDELSLEDWRLAEAAKRRSGEEVVSTHDLELDEEEKRLLQEAKSKGYYHGRLHTVRSAEAPTPQQVLDSSPASASSGAVGSEWNQAGTWEEKNCSAWAKERLTSWLQNALVSKEGVAFPSGSTGKVSAKITKVKTLTGEAHIVYVRKQPRHGYNYEAELGFSLVLGDHGTFSGTLNIPDLMDAVAVAELHINAKWKSSSCPSAELSLLASEWLDKLKESVRNQIVSFREEYQKRT